MDTGTTTGNGGDGELGGGITVLLQAAGGSFVACELGLEGERKATLLANRTTPGDWERFTMYTKPDGRVAFQAANGKFIASDDYRAHLLVADRDQAGDWETFTLEPKDGGKVALKTHNGLYVAADFGIEGEQKGRLVGDRREVKEWEVFTIVPDTTIHP